MEELTLFSISIRMATFSSECLFFSKALLLEYLLYYKTVSNQLGMTDRTGLQGRRWRGRGRRLASTRPAWANSEFSASINYTMTPCIKRSRVGDVAKW